MSTITFRSTPEVDEALTALTLDAGDRSRAIRGAILVAHRLNTAERVRAAAESLADDERDAAEARAVLADMEGLRAW